MENLHQDRVQAAPPFTYCAVHYLGPWYVKEGRREVKRYGVLFTCMASRAVHVEVAKSPSTDPFISAYRRFVGRRGAVRHISSDQGTIFIGAKNELQEAFSEMDNNKIMQDLLNRNCDWVDWKMNVSHASHMGGTWERQIRTVRNVLAALLSRHGSQLGDESLHTFMIEAEAIVNCHPLAVSDMTSPECLQPLSPRQQMNSGLDGRPIFYCRCSQARNGSDQIGTCKLAMCHYERREPSMKPMAACPSHRSPSQRRRTCEKGEGNGR